MHLMGIIPATTITVLNCPLMVLCHGTVQVDIAFDYVYSMMSWSTHTKRRDIENYTGKTLTVRGEMQCDIVYKVQKYTLQIIVTIIVRAYLIC